MCTYLKSLLHQVIGELLRLGGHRGDMDIATNTPYRNLILFRLASVINILMRGQEVNMCTSALKECENINLENSMYEIPHEPKGIMILTD